MEELKNKALTETELLRSELVTKLEGLMTEVEKHRKTDGRLSLAAIDQMLTITRAVIELTGARKPVVEKVEVRRRTISFQVQTVRTADGKPVEEPKIFEIKEPLTLEAGPR